MENYLLAVFEMNISNLEEKRRKHLYFWLRYDYWMQFLFLYFYLYIFSGIVVSSYCIPMFPQEIFCFLLNFHKNILNSLLKFGS